MNQANELKLHHVQTLIQKAIDTEDPETRQEFINVIAFYMKLAYRTWNQDQFVNDETIKSDLKMMSKGKLVVEDDHVINTKAYNVTPRKPSNNRSGGRNNNNRGRNNNNKNRGGSNKRNNHKRK